MQTLRQSDKCFCQYQFWCKSVNFVRKNWNFGRNVDFFIKCPLILKVIIFLQNIFILEKCDFLSEGLYTLIKLSNSDKKLQFLRYIDLYVLIFIKVSHLLESCYFDSKYNFLQWNFGEECHFPSKIYITVGIHSWEKLSNVLRKMLI